METWIIVLIILVVLLVILPMIIFALAAAGIFQFAKKVKETGFCFTDSQSRGTGCELGSVEECNKWGGKHFKDMDDCQDYWDNHKKKKESYNYCSSC